MTKPFDDRQARFIEIIADGGVWAEAQAELRVSSATLSKWLREDEDLEKQYIRARESQGDVYADRVIATAENPNLDPNEKRVRIDAYKWAAGKRKPKVYGDRVQIGGDPDNPLNIVTRIERVIVDGPNATDRNGTGVPATSGPE